MLAKSLTVAPAWFLALALSFCTTAVFAQVTTVGELLDKGGKKLTKEDYVASFPAKVAFVWPNKQGEADLTYAADGAVTGTEKHYGSSTTSAAKGKWSIDEEGRICTEKYLTDWNSYNKQCWFTFALGEDHFFGKDADRDAKLMKSSMKK